MSETVGVVVTREYVVSRDVVRRVTNEFAEWLEREGFVIQHPHDDTDYERLATRFAEGVERI